MGQTLRRLLHRPVIHEEWVLVDHPMPLPGNDEWVLVDHPMPLPGNDDLPPEIADHGQPQSLTNMAPKAQATFSVTARGKSPLNYAWEHSKESLKVVHADAAERRRHIVGEAAAEAFQNHYYKLSEHLTPEDVAPKLLEKKIITKRVEEQSRMQAFPRQDRAQTLIRELMRSVVGKPQWIPDIIEIFESAQVPRIQDVKDDFERLVKEAEGWKQLASSDTRFEGTSTPSLTIKSVEEVDQGSYQCVVSNELGTVTSNSATLTVAEPIAFTSHPQHQLEVTPGSEVKFTVKATGTVPGATQYTWWYLPLNCEDQESRTWRSANGEGVHGGDSRVLSITEVSTAHQGEYRCVISDRDVSESSNHATLTVAKLPEIVTQPHIDEEVVAGDDIRLSVRVKESTLMQYSWRRRQNVTDDGEWCALEDSDHITGTNTAVLTLHNVKATSSGFYQCVVRNPAGVVESDPVVLNVIRHDEIVSRLKQSVLLEERMFPEQKKAEVQKFVRKYGPRHEVVKLGLIAVIEMGDRNVELVRAFLSDFVPAEFMQDGKTPLHTACMNGDSVIAELLLENGAKKNARTEHEGKTPLHVVVERGDYRIATILLRNDVDVRIRNKDGHTSLHLACVTDIPATSPSIVQLLVHHDESTVDGLDDERQDTPLHLACRHKKVHAVRMLLKCISGENRIKKIKKRNKDGNIPLHLACEANCPQLVEALYEFDGFSPYEYNNEWFTPLHIAARKGNQKIAKLLLKHCPRKVTTTFLNDNDNKDKDSALHIASKEGHAEVVNILLEYSADKRVRNKGEKTPADVARCNGHTDISELLDRVSVLKRLTHPFNRDVHVRARSYPNLGGSQSRTSFTF